MSDSKTDYPTGTLRARRPDGTYMIASPHDMMYSTVTMLATDYWKDGSWHPIYPDDVDTEVRTDDLPTAAEVFVEPEQTVPAEPAPERKRVRVIYDQSPYHMQEGVVLTYIRGTPFVEFPSGNSAVIPSEQLTWLN